jgi:hypothetical protein
VVVALATVVVQVAWHVRSAGWAVRSLLSAPFRMLAPRRLRPVGGGPGGLVLGGRGGGFVPPGEEAPVEVEAGYRGYDCKMGLKGGGSVFGSSP